MINIINKIEEYCAKLSSLIGEDSEFGAPEIWKNKAYSFDYESLSNILHYEMYDDLNQIFYNKNSNGFVLEATTLVGASEQTANVLTRIISEILPESYDIQFLLWGSDKTGFILDNYQSIRRDSSIFAELSLERTSYLKKGAYESLTSDGPNLIRDYRLIISVSAPAITSLTTDISQLLSIRENIVSALISIQITTKIMTINEFINFITDILHPTFEVYSSQKKYNDYDSISDQLVNTDNSITVHPGYLIFEQDEKKHVATTYNVRSFPTHSSLAQMDDSIGKLYDKVNQLQCPFLISFHVRLSKKGNSNFRTTIKAIDTEKSANSKQRSLLTHLGRKSEELKLIQDRLHQGEKLVETYFQITLFTTPDSVIKAENALLSLYESNGWKLQKITKLQLQSLLAALPMRISEMVSDLRAFGRFYTMSAFNAANICPVLSEWKGTNTPHLLFTGRRGQLCNFSPHDNEKGNFNVVIAAQSGAGKSVLAQDYACGVYGTGGKVWIIDIGRSFQSICELLSGTFIDFDPEKPFCINPFTHITDFKSSLQLLKILFGIMARPSSNVTDDEMIYLEQAISAVWEVAGNDADVRMIAEWLSQQSSKICKNLSLLLYSYTKGGYAQYFVGRSNVDLSNPFVVVELERLVSMPQLMRIVLMILSFQITEAMYFGDKFQIKTLLIDEYWRFTNDSNDIASQAMGNFIGELARTVRKYNGSLVTIVQSIEDYFTKPSAIAVYNNSDFLIVMRQKEETLAKLSSNNHLSMNPLSEKLYRSLEKTNEYSELIIKGPSGLSLQRLILDPFSRILYSSKAEEFESIKNYREKGFSLIQAVKQVAKDIGYV